MLRPVPPLGHRSSFRAEELYVGSQRPGRSAGYLYGDVVDELSSVQKHLRNLFAHVQCVFAVVQFASPEPRAIGATTEEVTAE